MSEWKTAAEWAEQHLEGLPKTKSGLIRLAKRECWQDEGATSSRKRTGSGGGWEYHVSCLPEEARLDWERRQGVAELATRAEAAQEVAKVGSASLDARRRIIMEARVSVVIELQRRAILLGGSFSKAVAEFLAEAGAGLLEEPLASTVKNAVEKSRGKPPSRPTLFNWRRAYLDGGPLALAPEKRAQESKQETPEWLPDFLRFYANPAKPTMAHALEKMEERFSEVPSYAQVRRAMAGLKGTEKHLLAHKGREGPLALKARLMFTRRTLEGMDPATIYTADGKTFDAEIAHPLHGRPFRPEITTIVDVVTRVIVGWSVDLAENARAVADALRMACVMHAIPAIFYTDRGPGYRNATLDHETLGLCARLGITTTHSLPYNSQARGIIERVNGTVWNKAAKEFVSYMGPDMDREAAQRFHKQSRREIKQFGESRSLPSFSDFLTVMKARVAAYNDAAHSSLRLRDAESGRMRRATPNEIWSDFARRGFEPFTVTTAEADELFRPHVKRKTRRGEIEFLTNQYSHPALQAYHGLDVLVGYDIHDAGRVWVRELERVDGKEYPGALICVADFWNNKERYMPMTFQRHAEEKRARGQMRRHDEKRQRIELDLDPLPAIEAAPEMPSSIVSPTPQPQPVPLAANVVELPPVQAVAPHRDPRNPWSDPDIALAWKIIDSPNGTPIPPHHIDLMQIVLNNLGAVNMMRDVGLPVHELEDRLRDAPAPNQSSLGG